MEALGTKVSGNGVGKCVISYLVAAILGRAIKVGLNIGV